jgi:very-short-patch-repair endonuclease
VRQHRIELAGRRLRLDLAYPELKIAMEGDGFGIHTERGAFEDDRSRQNLLVLHGWLVLRSTWRMLIHTPWQVAKDVFDARQLRIFGRPMANGWP